MLVYSFPKWSSWWEGQENSCLFHAVIILYAPFESMQKNYGEQTVTSGRIIALNFIYKI